MNFFVANRNRRSTFACKSQNPHSLRINRWRDKENQII